MKAAMLTAALRASLSYLVAMRRQVLEPTEHTLDKISQLVGFGVKRMRAFSGRIVRNDGDRSALAQEESKAVAVIGGVCGA